MVRLYAISVFYKPDLSKAIEKKAAYELSSFGFFNRSSVREFMAFTSEVLAQRTSTGERRTVKEQEYRCHVYVRSDCLACVVIADSDYPPRVVFTLMSKVLEMFSSDFPQSSWSQKSSDLSYPPLDSFIKKYQNPTEADSLMRVQNDLDETKVILHETIEHMLERGQKLDELVDKTDKLSGTSKAFYKEVCTVLLCH
jgi:synaptobrevin family protein YKT6